MMELDNAQKPGPGSHWNFKSELAVQGEQKQKRLVIIFCYSLVKRDLHWVLTAVPDQIPECQGGNQRCPGASE